MPKVRLLVNRMKHQGIRYEKGDEFECSDLHLKSHSSRLEIVKTQKQRPKKSKPKVDAAPSIVDKADD